MEADGLFLLLLLLLHILDPLPSHSTQCRCQSSTLKLPSCQYCVQQSSQLNLLICNIHSIAFWGSKPSQEGFDLGGSCLPGFCQRAGVSVYGLCSPGVGVAWLAGLVLATLLQRVRTLLRCQLRLKILRQQQSQR